MVENQFEARRAILVGDVGDIRHQRNAAVLRNNSLNPNVAIEFYSSQNGIVAGLNEVKSLLDKVLPDTGCEIWALDEGEDIKKNDVVLRIIGPYGGFGLYEPSINGILSSCSGWATATKECVKNSGEIPILARVSKYVHPNVSELADYSSVIGGATQCSTNLGARISNTTTFDTMSDSLSMLFGDAVIAAKAYDSTLQPDIQRIFSIGAIESVNQEALKISDTLKEKTRGVELVIDKYNSGDVHIINELKVRLDNAGYNYVEIYLSGNAINPDSIADLNENSVPVQGIIVEKYIGAASPLSFSSEIKQIDGSAVARNGKIPGLTNNTKLNKLA